MKLIHITGKKGSGKTTLLKIIEDEGFPTEEVSVGYEFLAKYKPWLIETLPPPSEFKEHVIKIVYEYYWKEKYSDDCVLFFTGLYRPSEVEYLKKKGVLKFIVAVKVSKDYIRYERLLKRKRPGEENFTLEDFIIKDLHRDGLVEGYRNNNVSKIIEIADYVIYNDGTIEDLKREAYRLLEELERREIISRKDRKKV